jgi:hypothetical protein
VRTRLFITVCPSRRRQVVTGMVPVGWMNVDKSDYFGQFYRNSSL